MFIVKLQVFCAKFIVGCSFVHRTPTVGRNVRLPTYHNSHQIIRTLEWNILRKFLAYFIFWFAILKLILFFWDYKQKSYNIRTMNLTKPYRFRENNTDWDKPIRAPLHHSRPGWCSDCIFPQYWVIFTQRVKNVSHYEAVECKI